MTPTLTQHPGWLSACNGIWSRRPKWPVKVLSPADLQWATDQLVTMRDEPTPTVPTTWHKPVRGPDVLICYGGGGGQPATGGGSGSNIEPTVPPNWSDPNREVFTGTCKRCEEAFDTFDVATSLCQRCYLETL